MSSFFTKIANNTKQKGRYAIVSVRIDACVMEVSTGREKWISLPCPEIEQELSGYDKDDLLIIDSSSMMIELGSDIFKADTALKMCNALGIDDDGKIEALRMAVGCDAISDPDFLDALEHDFSIHKIDVEWPRMTDTEIVACWLATEEYIPFGETEMGDLVIVEDKLIDFIDWESVWDDYEACSWVAIKIEGVLYAVQLR